MKKKLAIIDEQLDQLIYEIRGQRVMLDSDLARVYGVTTKRLNEQFRRNRDRFRQAEIEPVANCDRFAKAP